MLYLVDLSRGGWECDSERERCDTCRRSSPFVVVVVLWLSGCGTNVRTYSSHDRDLKWGVSVSPEFHADSGAVRGGDGFRLWVLHGGCACG